MGAPRIYDLTVVLLLCIFNLGRCQYATGPVLPQFGAGSVCMIVE